MDRLGLNTSPRLLSSGSRVASLTRDTDQLLLLTVRKKAVVIITTTTVVAVAGLYLYTPKRCALVLPIRTLRIVYSVIGTTDYPRHPPIALEHYTRSRLITSVL